MEKAAYILERRRFLALSTAALAPAVALAAPLRVTLSVPGPGNLLTLPLPLASRIGADQAEGLEFDIAYIGGGPQALRTLLERNCDFACSGLSTLALQKFNGRPVVCIAPMTRVPAYTLLVRADLRGQVKQVADLRGRVIGVKGHVPGGRSTAQLFAEYLLTLAGVSAQQANYVSAGQSYDSQHAALASRSVDAIVADEPFATRLVREKVAYVLADYHDPQDTRRLMGSLFLNAILATRDDVIASRPAVVEKMVRTVRRTLAWIDAHSAEQIVEAMAPAQREERTTLLEVLRKRKTIYTPDGRFSDEQLAAVDRFLHIAEPAMAQQGFSVRSAVDTRWAGSAP